MKSCLGRGNSALRLALGLGAFSLIAACAIRPESVSEEDIAGYDSAVESLGCSVVTESDYMAVGLQTGLSREQLMDITAYKLSSEDAVRLPDGGIELTTGACA